MNLSGRKTYLTMAVIIILSAISGWNEYCKGLEVVPEYCVNIVVPEWLFGILGVLGIYTRSVAKPK